jgi:hypothetical protein
VSGPSQRREMAVTALPSRRLLTPSDYPAQNAEPQGAAYPHVRPLELPVSVDEAIAAALAQLRASTATSSKEAQNA